MSRNQGQVHIGTHLRSDINVHIPQIVLVVFLMVLVERIYLNISQSLLIFVHWSSQPSLARMKMDYPQVRQHEHKDHSRSCTPVSPQGVLRMDGDACRVRQY